VNHLKIHVRNQLGGTVDLRAGMKEYQFGPDAEGTIEVEDGDYMYLDQLVLEKKQTPAETALAEIIKAMDDYKAGKTGWVAVETAVKNVVNRYSKYFEAEVQNNGQSPA
jgi:uncharacterized RmlC-like cupin family protein